MHDVGKVLFGLLKPETGEVLKDQKEPVKSASWAVRHGIGYVSKNRDQESLMLISSIADNICLPSLKDLTPFGPISDRKQKQLAEKWSERMEVKADSAKAAIYQLIMQMKEEGKSILLISEELQELIGMSDRIVLLRDGAVSGEFLRNEGLTEAKLIQKMI